MIINHVKIKKASMLSKQSRKHTKYVRTQGCRHTSTPARQSRDLADWLKMLNKIIFLKKLFIIKNFNI